MDSLCSIPALLVLGLVTLGLLAAFVRFCDRV
jgi:hypothetical protein